MLMRLQSAVDAMLTLESIRGVKLTSPPPSIFLALNFYSMANYESFGTTVLCSLTHLLTLIDVMIDDVIIISKSTCVLTKGPCKRTQQVTTLLGPTMWEVVGTCWQLLRGACKRTQHLLTLLA